MFNQYKVSVIIPAAGKGKRMKADKSKQFISIEGKDMLAYTIDVFQNMKEIDEIVIVVGKEDVEYVKIMVRDKYSFNKVSNIVSGGLERQDSVYNGLKVIDSDNDIVLIHDGARPMIQVKDIIKVIEETIIHKAVVLGVKVKDTIKVVNQSHEIVDTPPREFLYAIQTPQGFNKPLLVNAYEKSKKSKEVMTDDAMIVEKYGDHTVFVIEGDYSNIKMTIPDDLEMFKTYIEKQRKHI